MQGRLDEMRSVSGVIARQDYTSLVCDTAAISAAVAARCAGIPAAAASTAPAVACVRGKRRHGKTNRVLPPSRRGGLGNDVP